MKYAVEVGSGAVVYIPSFINIGSVVRGHTHTYKQ
jgi:tetrahydrodipicolinate N-succinyltransferase